MKVTHYGHSCFSVMAGGKHLLFDPFLKNNSLAKGINIEELKPDVIFISHGHFDHIEDAVEIAKNAKAKVICNFEIHNWLNKQGVENTQPLNAGSKLKLDWGTIYGTYAMHSSSFPDGGYAGLAQGFIIECDEGSFYYSGDTALTLEFKLIGEKYKLDFALLPIGDLFTMGIADAITCATYIHCKRIVGLHYNTWPPITIDKEQAVKQFAKAGKELILLDPCVQKDICRIA